MFLTLGWRIQAAAKIQKYFYFLWAVFPLAYFLNSPLRHFATMCFMTEDEDSEFVEIAFETASFVDFLDRHSEPSEEGTAVWAYCFNAQAHDVHVLVMSGNEAPHIMAAASRAAGLSVPRGATIH